jgi:hypothetical protein
MTCSNNGSDRRHIVAAAAALTNNRAVIITAISINGWPAVRVYGEEISLSVEAMMMATAEKLNLPVFGPKCFGDGVFLTRPEHLYLKQVAIIVFGEKEDCSESVPEADEERLRNFQEAQRHLPRTVFDGQIWKVAADNDDSLWRKVVFVMKQAAIISMTPRQIKATRPRLANFWSAMSITTS